MATEQLTLTQVGQLLDMRKANVRKYLERHGVAPAGRKDDGAGDVWNQEDIDPLVQQRREKRASNRRRSDAAKRSIQERGPYRARSVNVSRLGHTQRYVLTYMAEHDNALPTEGNALERRQGAGVKVNYLTADAIRLAFNRLRERRLVRERNGLKQLTTTGMVAAAKLKEPST